MFHRIRRFAVPRALAVLAVALMTLAAARGADAQGTMAEPEPSWDDPRKVLLQITDRDPEHVGHVFSNAVNIQKFYGVDFVKVAIVAYGPGVRQFMTTDTEMAARIESLAFQGIEFLVCGNTLDTIGVGHDVLVEGASVVPAGIPEIVERKMQGWHYIVPDPS